MTKVYRIPTGSAVPGRRLGRGGEGEVFALADGSPRALKIYASPDAAREAKVRAMAAAGLALRCPAVAFPEAPAYATDGSFAGFVMPLVEGGSPIHELCSPGSRRREFPNADWRFLVRTAVNTARVFERVHAAGAVVGDVNGSGVLVSQRAVVSLIDADSFQWGTEHLCRVGVPDYTGPELQGRTLSGVVRTAQHDAFGLAVLIFQLLFLGRHPYAGVPKGREVPLVDAISQNCFAYSRLQYTRLAPPSGTLRLSDLPLAVATLFERAFAGFGQRPLPREWAAELEALETSIVACDHRDEHHGPAAAGGCAWCRVERAIGIKVFGSGPPSPPRSTAPTPMAHSAAARAVARARAEGGERVRPQRRARPRGPSSSAIETLERFSQSGTVGADGRRVLPPNAPVGKQFVSACQKARRDMDRAIEGWRNRVGAWTIARSSAELTAKILNHGAASREHQVALSQVADHLRDRRVAEELARLQLTAATVPGLGERGVARLAAAKITHAADLSRPALEAVRGVGERGIVALLIWRDTTAVAIGRRTIPDQADIVAAEEKQKTLFREKEAIRERELDRLSLELHAALDTLTVRAKQPDPRLETAIGAYESAVADLRHLGLSADEARNSVPIAPKPTAKPKKANGAACPVCGRPMVKRWARGGPSPNSFFLGCSSYPACTGSRPLKTRRP